MAPLQVNPALTGVESKYRASLLHRNQWMASSAQFSSTMASFDMRHGKSENQKSGQLSSGAMMLYDKSGDPEVRITRLNYNLAYDVRISEKSELGAGLVIGVHQIIADPTSGKWASQYNGVRYDPSINSGENFMQDAQSSVNLGGGMIYSFGTATKKMGKTKNAFSFTTGVAGFQLGSVVLQEANALNHEDHPRFVGFFNGKYTPGKNGWSFLPQFFYHQQGSFSQLVAGGFVQYEIFDGQSFASNSQRTAVSMGSFARAGESIIIKAMFEWSQFALAMAYDINYSRIRDLTRGRGAFEVGLLWRK